MSDEISFGGWVKKRRKLLDLTQEALAVKVGCSTVTIAKIENDMRRPSRQIAQLLAEALEVPDATQTAFVKAARGERRIDLLPRPQLSPADPPITLVNITSAPKLAPESQLLAVSNLPVMSSTLYGRQAECEQISVLLAKSECRLLTLLGPGGIGKTRLAVETARRLIQTFRDGVFFISLAPLRSPGMIVSILAEAIGFQFYNPSDPQELLFKHLRDKQCLLVFDNLEHLLDGAGFLAELLSRAPEIKLLVTSRERLNLMGEWVFDVQGLPFPSGELSIAAARLEEYSSVALFVERARRIHPAFAPGEVDLQSIATICRLLEGNPLGIELASAWARVLSPIEIAHEIERMSTNPSGLDFLAHSRRDVPERHRSLRATFEYSWNLLTTLEQDVLLKLSIFRGGFSREAAAQVAGANLQMLIALVDKSLLRRTGETRFDMHELVRQFTIARLSELSEQMETAFDRHSDYFAAFLAAREDALLNSRQSETIAEIMSETANLEMAWDWLVDHRKFEQIRAAADVLALLYETSNQLQNGTITFGYAVGVLSTGIHQPESRRDEFTFSQMNPEYRLTLGVTLGHLGYFSFRLGRFGAGREQLVHSLELLRTLDQGKHLGAVLTELGLVEVVAGSLQTGEEYLKEAQEIHRSCGIRRYEWLIQLFLGLASVQTNRLVQTQELLAASIATARSNRDERVLTMGLNALSQVLSVTSLNQRDLIEAKRLAADSLEISQRRNDRFGIGLAFQAQGTLAEVSGDYGQAEALLKKGELIFNEIGDRWSTIAIQRQLGRLALWRGWLDEAGDYFRSGLKNALAGQSLALSLDILADLTQASLQKDELERAVELAAFVLEDPLTRIATRERVAGLLAEYREALLVERVQSARRNISGRTLQETATSVLGQV